MAKARRPVPRPRRVGKKEFDGRGFIRWRCRATGRDVVLDVYTPKGQGNGLYVDVNGLSDLEDDEFERARRAGELVVEPGATGGAA